MFLINFFEWIDPTTFLSNNRKPNTWLWMFVDFTIWNETLKKLWTICYHLWLISSYFMIKQKFQRKIQKKIYDNSSEKTPKIFTKMMDWIFESNFKFCFFQFKTDFKSHVTKFEFFLWIYSFLFHQINLNEKIHGKMWIYTPEVFGETGARKKIHDWQFVKEISFARWIFFVRSVY